MKKVWNILTLFLFALIITSCEKDDPVPDQTKIYTEYSINYNETLDKTTATAAFSYDPTDGNISQKLELTHPAHVTYNGKQLIFDNEERNYQKEFIGLIEDKFIYTNYFRIPYPNIVEVADSISIEVPTDSTSLYSDFYVGWVGNPIQEDERIVLTICNLQSGKEIKIVNGNAGANYVNIVTSDLVYVGEGNAVIKLIRQKTTGTDYSPEAGGSIIMNYETEDTVYFY